MRTRYYQKLRMVLEKVDTAVQSYIERIQKALDKQVHTIGIFIDQSKAYDVLNHNI
jgi:hypothetical protein